MHAEIEIGTARLFLADENLAQGVQAGATAVAAPVDMFWGDRWSLVTDPFGHQWQIATHKEDLTQEEMHTRMAAMGA